MNYSPQALLPARFFSGAPAEASIFLLLLLLILALFSPTHVSALEQDAEPRNEAEPELNAEQELARKQREELMRSVAGFEQEVERLESEAGPYHPALRESLQSLGEAYQQLERHVDALAVFEQALHIERVTNGLFSEEQLPVLEQLIESSSTIEDWESADASQHLAWHVSSRAFATGGTAYAEALSAFGDWKLRAYRNGLLSSSGDGGIGSIRELKQLYAGALEQTGEESGQEPEAVLTLLGGKAQAEYELANHVSRLPLSFFRGTIKEYSVETICQNVRTASGEIVRACERVRRPNPHYYDSLRREKQFQLRHALVDMRRTIDEMEGLLESHPDLSAGPVAARQPRPGELNALYAELIRDSRRGLSRAWSRTWF